MQTLTPDAMRGRVNAVNSVFISTSNELGGFEFGCRGAASLRRSSPWSAAGSAA